MLALGTRLADRGHEVMLETWGRWQAHVEAAGMHFSPAPEYPVFPTREQPLKPYEAVVRATPVTQRALAGFGPAVVVHDILTLAPALAGELQSVPVATLVPHLHPSTEPGFPPFSCGARMPRTRAGRLLWRSTQSVVEGGLALGQAQLNEARTHLSLPPVKRLHGGISDRLCIVGTFPQLEYPRAWPREVQIVGPLLWEPAAAPLALPAGNDPLVLVAPSTAHDRGHRLVCSALAGLAREPVRVVAATYRRPHPPDAAEVTDSPGQHPSAASTEAGAMPLTNRGATDVLAHPPANARLADWIPYGMTMARCQLVISHVGHGTLALALAAGCPVVAVPHSGDMPENAARIDWAGLGVRLPWRFVTPTTVRLAVRRALAEPRFARRASVLASWAAHNDGAGRAADLVEELAAGGF